MSYSLDFRQKVINYIENGGQVVKAAKTFGIARATIYRCLGRKDLEATKVERRKIKLDWNAKLIERAKRFGVHPTTIWYALDKMKINKKSNSGIEKKTERKGSIILEFCNNS